MANRITLRKARRALVIELKSIIKGLLVEGQVVRYYNGKYPALRFKTLHGVTVIPLYKLRDAHPYRITQAPYLPQRLMSAKHMVDNTARKQVFDSIAEHIGAAEDYHARLCLSVSNAINKHINQYF